MLSYDDDPFLFLLHRRCFFRLSSRENRDTSAEGKVEELVAERSRMGKETLSLEITLI